MPLAKMDIIRTKQSEIVSALVTLAKYTGKVYKTMTPYQFQLELQNVERMDTLCARACRTARSGQQLAPRVGPYAYYYRMFEDFFEIIQLEYDKLLTQNRLMVVPEPPPPPYTNNSLHVIRHVIHLLQPKAALTSAKLQQDFAQSWTVTEHRLTANLTMNPTANLTATLTPILIWKFYLKSQILLGGA
jgi:hypothetical protein